MEANEILQGERGIPIMDNVRMALQVNADETTNVMYNFVDLIGTFKTGDVNVISPECKTIIEDQYKLLVEQVIYGDKTPEEAAQEIYDFASKQFK